MTKTRRDNYQQGLIRHGKLGSGFAWDLCHAVEENASQYFDGTGYRTDKVIRQKLNPNVSI